MLALLVAEPAPDPPLRPSPSEAAPPLQGVDLAGRKVELSRLRGRVVLVHFWATWCEPCRDELSSLAQVHSRLGSRPLEVLSVNFGEGAERIEPFLRAVSIHLPVVLDPDHRVAQAWGVTGLPMTFLVDARGRIRFSVLGARDWSEGTSARALEELLAEAELARR